MKKAGEILVAKREGGLEPFEVAKPRRCLAAAMRDCKGDQRFADALARAVELHLAEWTRTRPPTTEYVFRCLRIALTETGMDRVAQQLAGHRRRRASQRRRLSVFDADAPEPQRALTPWRKAAVARTLEARYELNHSVARILAGEIERRVLALEYTVVSTALIVELVRNELLAWGLADAVTGAAPGMPPEDVIGERQTKTEH